jgi:hypothetical protein
MVRRLLAQPPEGPGRLPAGQQPVRHPSNTLSDCLYGSGDCYGAYRLVRRGFASCRAITGDYSGLSIMSLNRYLACCVSVCNELRSASGSSQSRTARVSHVTTSNFCEGWSGLFASNAARAVRFCRTMEHETGRERTCTWLARRG